MSDIAVHVCAANGLAIEKASDAFWALAELGLIRSQLADLKEFARWAATLAVEPPAPQGRS